MSKITLVTGGSRGIGKAVSLMAAEAGHAVAVNYNTDAEAAYDVVAAINDAGGQAIPVRADCSVEADVLEMFRRIDEDLGRLTGLVNNAGIHGPRGPFQELEVDDISRVLAVNVQGYFLCAREAIKRMSTKRGGAGGSIVNVSSGSANIGSPGVGVLYAASKGAVNSLTIGLSQEVVADGIRVNTVAPGLTETDMTKDSLDRRVPALPMRRAAQPDEIAATILFLMSDAASYVAGANLRVGGGKPG